MKLKVNGLDKVILEITKLETSIPKEIDTELKKIADGILADAVSRVHVLSGDLKRSAFIDKIEGGYTIGFSISYAPYEEFGTGGLVNAPSDYVAYAMEFKVPDGRIRNGEAHPYLFPAFLAKRDKIVDELALGIEKLIKGFNKA